MFYQWNEKAEKNYVNLKETPFQKMNFNELEDYCDILNNQ